jgi:hypothetical protein
VTHPDRDPDLEMWLRRSSSLHQQLARLDRAEPPEELDRVVLHKAREAIRSPRSVSPLRMRWALPLGLAATLIVAFTLMLQVGPSPVTTGPAPASADVDRSQEQSARSQRYQAVQDETASEPPALSRPIEIAPAEVPDAASGQAMPGRSRLEVQGTTAARKQSQAAANARDALPMTAPPAAQRKDADLWLAEIERLRADGLVEEADRQFEEFRRAYPDRNAMPAATPAPEDR